jgi:hypothetical protein
LTGQADVSLDFGRSIGITSNFPEDSVSFFISIKWKQIPLSGGGIGCNRTGMGSGGIASLEDFPSVQHPENKPGFIMLIG